MTGHQVRAKQILEEAAIAAEECAEECKVPNNYLRSAAYLRKLNLGEGEAHYLCDQQEEGIKAEYWCNWASTVNVLERLGLYQHSAL